MTNEETPTRVGGYIVLTRSQNWAWGATPEDAFAALRKRHDRARKGDRAVYRLPVGAIDGWVDQMGSIRWDWADDAPDRHRLGEMIESPTQ
jgi:hypothetical protein